MGFKAGQRLKCIDIKGLPPGTLELGGIYTAEHDTKPSASGNQFVSLKEKDGALGGWFANRFEEALSARAQIKAGQKLKCIKTSHGTEKYGNVKAGEIYTASSVESGGRVVVGGVGAYHFAYPVEIFEVVAEPPKAAFVPKIKKGDKLEVIDDSDSSSISKGDIVVAASDSSITSAGNEVVSLEGVAAYKHYYVTRFRAVPAPKKVFWAKGQRLQLLQTIGHMDVKPGTKATVLTDCVEGSSYVDVSFDGPGQSYNGAYRTAYFAPAAPVPRPEWAIFSSPKFKRGDKVRCIVAADCDLKVGTIGTALEDSHMGYSRETVSIAYGDHPYGVNHYVEKLELATTPELRLPPPKFRRGQFLKCLSGAMGIIEKGDIVRANANSYLGVGGNELVQVEDQGGKDHTFYVDRFEVTTEPEPGALYFVTDGTDSFLTDDIKDAAPGMTVTTYKKVARFRSGPVA